MALPNSYQAKFYPPDLATHLLMRLKGSSRPAKILFEFVKQTMAKQMTVGLTPEEEEGLCSTAMEIFQSTDNRCVQMYCFELVAATQPCSAARKAMEKIEYGTSEVSALIRRVTAPPIDKSRNN